MKRVLIILICLCMVTTCGFCRVQATGVQVAEKLILGDLSSATEEIEDGLYTKWLGSSGRPHKRTDDITLTGKNYSLEWTEFSTNDSNAQTRARLRTENNWTVADLLNASGSRKYTTLNVWLYSAAANSQNINFYITDSTTSVTKYIKWAITTDWTGWKLCKVDISGMFSKLSDFDKKSNGEVTKAAVLTDKVYVHFQASGYDAKPLSNSLLYVDSFWFDNSETSGLEPDNLTLSSNVTESSVVKKEDKIITITANDEFKTGYNEYWDKVTVKKGEETLTQTTYSFTSKTDASNTAYDYTEFTDGTQGDYLVQQENEKLHIEFEEELEVGATYTVTLSKDAVTDGNHTIGSANNGEDYTVTFTVKDDYETSYSFGEESVPESGSVAVTASLGNYSGADTTAKLFLGAFDKTTFALKACAVSAATEVKDGFSGTLTATVTADSFSNCVIKAYLWENGTLRPYKSVVGNLD